MKIRVLSRSKSDHVRESAGGVRRIERSFDPTLHPFQKAREYTRALNAAKVCCLIIRRERRKIVSLLYLVIRWRKCLRILSLELFQDTEMACTAWRNIHDSWSSCSQVLVMERSRSGILPLSSLSNRFPELIKWVILLLDVIVLLL